ncbi:hypothetical protein OG272_25735 [Streptomyces sp. NBC_00104]|uniref:hypothetical protein n=1 Tax=unclassified Streptomyces TaxID=2593676 RepID=UPI0032502347
MATLKYHPDDITELHVMDYLQRNERQFFRSGGYNSIELAGMIATEALMLGADNVRIHSHREWMTVTADKDWLEPYEHEAFHEITPFPEAGANSMLAEVLAVAFSAGVTTTTRVGARVITGEADAPAHLMGQDMARAVAFRHRRGLRPLA